VKKYPHPHRYDNVNFPEQEYKDVFGGTLGNNDMAERDHHNIGLISGESSAMMEHKRQAKRDSINQAANAVDEINAGRVLGKSE